jgi:translation initiation factor 3 subunit M
MSSSLLIQTSEEDPWVASAQYVGSILEKSGESSSAAEAYANSIREAYASENLSQVLDLFVSKLQIVYTNTENDQDLEGFTNVCTHLPPRCENSTQAASQLAAALSADPTNRPERRLQGLINLYNTVLESSSKLHVLLAIMAFAKASSLADILLNVVKGSIDSWISTLELSKVDQRTLFVACADSLESCTRKPKTAARESYRLRIRALKTYSAADLDAHGLQVAAKVVREYIVSPDLFQFDVADIPAVKALDSSSEYKDVYAVLKLFLDGTVKEFRSFMADKGKAVAAMLDSSEDALLSKMMLMALVGLVNRRASVSFKEIGEALDLSNNSDVENLIVRAIGKKLLEAKIDQLAEVVVISKCSSRKFERGEWEGLSADLKQWRQSIEDVLTLGTDTKTALFTGLEKLDDGFSAKAMQV